MKLESSCSVYVRYLHRTTIHPILRPIILKRYHPQLSLYFINFAETYAPFYRAFQFITLHNNKDNVSYINSTF